MLAQYDMAVSKNQKMQDMLAPYEVRVSVNGQASTTKGCTHTRHLMLLLTTDVIARSRTRIQASGEKSLSPKRCARRPSGQSPNDYTSAGAGATEEVGEARKHRQIKVLYSMQRPRG